MGKLGNKKGISLSDGVSRASSVSPRRRRRSHANDREPRPRRLARARARNTDGKPPRDAPPRGHCRGGQIGCLGEQRPWEPSKPSRRALDARGCIRSSWSSEPARPRERNVFRARVIPRRAWTLRGYAISGVRANGWGRTSSGIASWCAFESAQRRGAVRRCGGRGQLRAIGGLIGSIARALTASSRPAARISVNFLSKNVVFRASYRGWR